MKETNYAVVVNSGGNRVDFEIVECDDNGSPVPQHHTMQPGESLVFEDWQTANAMLKPRWTGETWQETATPQEVEEARPTPQALAPDPLDEIRLALAELAELMIGGM